MMILFIWFLCGLVLNSCLIYKDGLKINQLHLVAFIIVLGPIAWLVLFFECLLEQLNKIKSDEYLIKPRGKKE